MRDCVFVVVYEVSYKPGFQEKAYLFQLQMKEILDEEFKEKDTIRMMWGSYGDVDIKKVG